MQPPMIPGDWAAQTRDWSLMGADDTALLGSREPIYTY